MARLFSNRDRPFDMGVLPTELLARDAALPVVDARMPAERTAADDASILGALPEYQALCARFLHGEVAAARATA